MPPTPSVIGLMICEMAIQDAFTGNVSLIAEFDVLNVPGFPVAPSFVVYSRLADSEGPVELELVIELLDVDEEVYRRVYLVTFPNRLNEVRSVLRVKKCTFEKPGVYEASLLANGEWLASRVFRVQSQQRGEYDAYQST